MGGIAGISPFKLFRSTATERRNVVRTLNVCQVIELRNFPTSFPTHQVLSTPSTCLPGGKKNYHTSISTLTSRTKRSWFFLISNTSSSLKFSSSLSSLVLRSPFQYYGCSMSRLKIYLLLLLSSSNYSSLSDSLRSFSKLRLVHATPQNLPTSPSFCSSNHSLSFSIELFSSSSFSQFLSTEP